MWMSRVTLRPRVTWGSNSPDDTQITDLHHRAHDACFIANSVTTKVTVE
jgi:organic hydroperoxide reductase OsmC/OhrA